MSDFAAVDELITHGFAENAEEAAKKAFNSGLDMEMASTAYADHL